MKITFLAAVSLPLCHEGVPSLQVGVICVWILEILFRGMSLCILQHLLLCDHL